MFLSFDNLHFLRSNLKSLQVSYFSQFFLENPKFSECVLCHWEMFDWTTFGLDIGVCSFHAVILINKYLENMFTISFNDFLKILIMVNFKNVEKIMPCSFFKSGLKIVSYQKSKTITSSMLKKWSAWYFWIFYFFISVKSHLKKIK